MHSTEKRILYVGPHGKTHPAARRLDKVRLSVRESAQTAPFRETSPADCAFPLRRGAREVWGNPPPGCGALWRMPQLGKCARATTRQPAGRVVSGSADLGSESDLTERRILAAASRKDALWGCHSHGKAHPAARRLGKVRLSVRDSVQTALFRETVGTDCAFP